PTTVPGLSWDTPEGRVRHVRMPHDGEYVAEYVPDRIRERQRQVLAVMASQSLRAGTNPDRAPPPLRLIAPSPRRPVSHLRPAPAAGPAAFVEAVRPLPVRRVVLSVGATFGYLRSETNGLGPDASGDARFEVEQVPLLALARARLPLPLRVELSAELDAGMTLARTHLTTNFSGKGFDVEGGARALALGGGAEMALTLKPGRLVIGVRYLWSELGRTTQGDEITGNSVGVIGDIGYRMSF